MSDDRELWKRIASGNADAFDAWYRETAPRLRSFLRHLLANEQAVEDVMQETFTQIWHRPHRFDPDRGSPRAYLFGAARRQAAEWRRKQHAADEPEFEPLAPSRVEIASMVTEAFNRLTLEHRTILWLREVEGQSYEELAMILDVPLGTVRSRLFAAREALRVLWGMARQPAGGRHDL
ncbi:MAG: RNA polymerase sigma factor [Terriglobia bacterium]